MTALAESVEIKRAMARLRRALETRERAPGGQPALPDAPPQGQRVKRAMRPVRQNIERNGHD